MGTLWNKGPVAQWERRPLWLERKSKSNLYHLPTFLAPWSPAEVTAAGEDRRPREGEFRGRRVCHCPWLWEPSFKAGEGSAFIQEPARRGADLGTHRGCAPPGRGLWGGGAGPSGDLPRASTSGTRPPPRGLGGGRARACRWGHLQPHTWRRLERTWLQLREFSIVKPLSRSGKRFRMRTAGFRGRSGSTSPTLLAFGGRVAVHVLR